MTTLHLGTSISVPPLSGYVATKTQLVSTMSTNRASTPRIAVDSHDNIHSVWADYTNYSNSGTDSDIVYQEYNATSLTWSTVQVVSTESTYNSYNPSIAIDSHDNVHVAWEDKTNFTNAGIDNDIFYKMFNTTTATWTTTTVISTESTGASQYPSIAVDSQNNIHIAWHDTTAYGGSGSDKDIFHKMFNATTGTWTVTDIISSESGGSSGYPDIAVDSKDNLHVTWTDNSAYGGSGGDTDVFYKMFNATTATWTTTEVVSTESSGASGYSKLAVDNQDNIHITWEDYSSYANSGTDGDIFYKMYNATTATWTTTQVVSTQSSVNSYNPALAVDSQDNVVVVWQDTTNYTNSGLDPDIIYKMYNTTTATWNSASVLSTESTQTADQPSIVIDSYDNIHVVWQDDTNYNNAGLGNDIFYKELVNLAKLPITSTQTTTRTETSTQLDTTTQTSTVTQSTTEHQTDITTVISTVSGTSNQNSTTNSSPWFILPTLMAIVSLGYVSLKQK